MGTPAKVLARGDVRRLLARAANRRYAIRNKVIISLSFKAGLRACEIAGLEWRMILGVGGRVGSSILVADGIAKNGRSRRVPVHPELKSLLVLLHAAEGRPTSGPVIRSQRGKHLSAQSVVNWFGKIYSELGMQGCSSHSGRRTFITGAARAVARVGGSLRDVQELAGHRALTTTERYIEGDRDAQRKLVRML